MMSCLFLTGKKHSLLKLISEITSDMALQKLIYLSVQHISETWYKSMKN